MTVEDEPRLRHFSYEHLKPELRVVSKAFADLALVVLSTLPQGAERAVCLRKLLEAKDCAVRAKVEELFPIR